MIPKLNLQTIVSDSSPYIRVEERNEGNRTIHRFILKDKEKETINQAGNVLRQFLQDNPTLCPLFDQKKIQVEVRKKYLVINSNVVCLSKRSAHSATRDGHRDIFFSDSRLNDPVACTKNHFLERAYIPFWSNSHGNRCPSGLPSHPITGTSVKQKLGTLYVNEALKKGIIKAANVYKRSKKNRLQTQLEHLNQLGSVILNEETRPIQTQPVATQIDYPYLGINTAQIGAEATSWLYKDTCHEMIKFLPGVGLLFGCMAIGNRLYKGELKQAAVEVVATSLPLVLPPGVGNLASMTLKAGLGLSEIHSASQSALEANQRIAVEDDRHLQAIRREEMDRKTSASYRFFNLNQNDPHFSLDTLNGAFRRIIMQVHPDRMRAHGDYFVDLSNHLTQAAREAQRLIQSDRRWNTGEDRRPHILESRQRNLRRRRK